MTDIEMSFNSHYPPSHLFSPRLSSPSFPPFSFLFFLAEHARRHGPEIHVLSILVTYLLSVVDMTNEKERSWRRRRRRRIGS